MQLSQTRRKRRRGKRPRTEEEEGGDIDGPGGVEGKQFFPICFLSLSASLPSHLLSPPPLSLPCAHSKLALLSLELIAAGRSLIKETDASLARSARVIAETLTVGARAAEEVDQQRAQLERVLDDADAVRESLGRARGLVVDVARGMATDRCLALLLLLVAAAAAAAAAARVVARRRGAREAAAAAAAAAVSLPAAATALAVGRKVLGLG